MAQGDKHFIHRLIIETQISDKRYYRDVSERISNLVRYTITDMLTRQFERFKIESDDLIVIDRLEIDLGNITLDKLETEIYNGLEKKIYQYITKLNSDLPSIAKMANFYQWRTGALEYKASKYKIIRKSERQLFQLEDKILPQPIQQIDLVNWENKYGEVLKFYLRSGYLPSNVYLGDLDIKEILRRYMSELYSEDIKPEKKPKQIFTLPAPRSIKKTIPDTLEKILKDPIARERFIQHSVEALLTKLQEEKLITKEEVENLIKPIAFQWIDILYARFFSLESLDWLESHSELNIDKLLFQLYNHKPSAIQNLMYALKSELRGDPLLIHTRVLDLIKQMNKGSIQKLISALYSQGSYLQKYLNELSKSLIPFKREAGLESNKIAHFALITYFLEADDSNFSATQFLAYVQNKFSLDEITYSELMQKSALQKKPKETIDFRIRKYKKADWLEEKAENLEIAELFVHVLKYSTLPLYNTLNIKSISDLENTLKNQSALIMKSIITGFKRISSKEIVRNRIANRISYTFLKFLALQSGFDKKITDLFNAPDLIIWRKNFINLLITDSDFHKSEPDHEKWKNKQIKKILKLLSYEPAISERLIKREEIANFILFLTKYKADRPGKINPADALLSFIKTSTGVSYREITKQFSNTLERLIPQIEKLRKDKTDKPDSEINKSIQKKKSESDNTADQNEFPEIIADDWLSSIFPESEKLIITPAKTNIEKDKLKIPYKSETFESDIAVRNAGLVLCWPFLGYYFSALGLLNEKKDFIDLEARERAVFLLQYLAVKQSRAEEHYLTLNKIMVGYPLDEPISSGIEMTKKEQDISEALLINVIKQWSALKSMKPDGLRGSFIIRDGVLRQMHNGWRLIVDKKGFDLLLNKIPWSLSMIRFSWVSYMINVEWN